MSESTRTILLVVFSLMQIGGVLLISLGCLIRLPNFFRIFIGIAGVAAILKYFVIPEPGVLHTAAAFAGVGILWFAIFFPLGRNQDAGKEET